jgi:hypothetical protein
LHTLRDEVLAGECGEHWKVADGLIVVRDKVYVQGSSPSVPHILESAHNVGHEDAEKTLHRLRADFHVPSARALVLDFVKSCTVC